MIRKWLEQLAGPRGTFSFEHRFMNMITLMAGVSALLAILINLILGITDPALFWTVTGLGILFMAEYYFCRFRNRVNLVKWLTTLILFPAFSYVFVINNGSQGPLLYLYMVFFLLIIFVWDGRPRWFFVILFLLNIGALFYVELRYPDLIKPYPSHSGRLLDVYLSYLIYVFLGSVILMSAKTNYVAERKKAEKSDRLKSAFLANMSHEIRTPMNAILGFSQLLEKTPSESEKALFIKTIKENSQTLLRLIEDIIDISKIEAGQVAIKPGEVYLPGLFEDLYFTFYQLLAAKAGNKVELVRDDKGSDVLIITDGDRIRQVMVNLLHNAVKFTKRGEIRFGYRIAPPHITFFVSDTGPGIREEFLEEVFDRFRKLEGEESDSIHRGAGIGLSISKNLSNLLGGELSVESEVGKGSTFNLTIPYEPAPAYQEKKDSKPKASQGDRRGIKKTVLVVEDENTNYMFLESMLRDLNLDTDRAVNGKEAVEMVKQHSAYALVLMDIRMPVMDGYEATRKIKQMNPRIPVIAQTAMAMEGDRMKSLEAGCDDYIAKPILLNEFQALIDKYLN